MIRTMLPPARLRLRPRLAAAGLALAVLAIAAPVVRGQTARTFPDGAEAGRLRMGVFPLATIDGRELRLGPGTRIYDENTMIRPPAMVDGERKIAYVRGQLGEVVQIWLLSDVEFRDLGARIAAARRAAPQR
jgi:hypothetical protein